MKKLIASILTVATIASMASISALADAPTTSEEMTKEAATEAIFVSDANYDTKEIVPDKDIYIDLAKIGDFTATKDNLVTAATLATLFTDDDIFKSKTDKGDDNTKMIKKISVTEKNVDGKDGREYVIKIELNDDMTDSDFKINPSVTFTAKYDMKDDGTKTSEAADIAIKSGTKYTVELGNFYVSNTVFTGDRDWDAGEGGFVAKPVKNDDNEITWEDENDTIAKLTFEGDSDVSKYYPKLSTKWDNADYAENFADTDAFIRSFVGTPTISATARPTLELYNPFIDEDDESTVDADSIVIYEVVDGALVDVTDKFTYGENDDGDSVFTIKTRTLGTYIFSAAAATAPADETPVDETPVDTGKENPGTGRF